jgi:hypothetical protein
MDGPGPGRRSHWLQNERFTFEIDSENESIFMWEKKDSFGLIFDLMGRSCADVGHGTRYWLWSISHIIDHIKSI